MKLFEIVGDLSYLGFHLKQEEEHEEDNIKIWHNAILPNGTQVTLDHTPYQFIDPTTFRSYVSFFKQHKRFPTRQDINSNGPLDNQDIEQLTR